MVSYDYVNIISDRYVDHILNKPSDHGPVSMKFNFNMTSSNNLCRMLEKSMVLGKYEEGVSTVTKHQ